MITASIDKDSFSRNINIALIPLLFKRDREPSDCATYRPLRLLNSDIKIYANVLVRRNHNHMSALVNCEQALYNLG